MRDSKLFCAAGVARFDESDELVVLVGGILYLNQFREGLIDARVESLLTQGEIIAAAHNEVERSNDPTAHAEMLAITQAAHKIGDWRLNDCTLYVTKEPCPMCSGAMPWPVSRTSIRAPAGSAPSGSSDKARAAFDIKAEPKKTRDDYGRNAAGQRMLAHLMADIPAVVATAQAAAHEPLLALEFADGTISVRPDDGGKT